MPHLDAALRRVEYIEPSMSDEDILESIALGSLSDREHEILHWVRSGKTNIEIGMILSISSNTVKNHLKRISKSWTFHAVHKPLLNWHRTKETDLIATIKTVAKLANYTVF